MCAALFSGSNVSAVNLDIARPAKSASAAVTWTVDHVARTITVTVRIAIFVPRAFDRGEGGASGGGHLPPNAAEAMAEAAARIEADIRKKWADLKFKCYQFIVDPQVHVVTDRDAVADDHIPVELTNALYPGGVWVTAPRDDAIRDFVRGERNWFKSDLSDDPDTQLTVATGPATRHSVWNFFAAPGTYAHEFGHLIGLNDNYNFITDGLKDGAPSDVMFNSAAGVSPETITKAIRRSGQVDESTIKCPFSIDLIDSPFGIPFGGIPGTAGGTIGFHAWACDYDPPTSDPERRKPIPVAVVFRAHGQADAGPFGSAAGGGESMYNVVIPPPPGAISGESVFNIPVGDGLAVTTRVEFGPTGLRTIGATNAETGGGKLPLGTATVSEGAPECK